MTEPDSGSDSEPAQSPELVPIRRKDRAVNDEAWIEEMLIESAAGVLAMSRGGQPFVNMNVFVYCPAEKCIYLHTASEGQTRANVEENERVCFCVHDMGRLLPAMYARNFSVEYSGVVAFGRVEIVKDEASASRALQLLLNKYAPHLKPGEHYRPITSNEIAQTTVYRIKIERWSGKRKVAPADHPGAFRFGEPAIPPWADWREQEAKS
jgi:nitroimidazol reductase NimA-like FMN-containing flavoprotein (pyridoxamine 5'-phosphate oxidase superfamily)